MNAPTTDLHYLMLIELAELLRSRVVSPVEVTRAQLGRIANLDGELLSYAVVMADQAVTDAGRAEREIAAGRYRGPLHGVPIGIKDLFWTEGVQSAGGMAIYRDFRPDRDATAVARLRDAGAVILGKLQMTEGAYSDHHPTIRPPRNPWNADYWTGISSSGPATATAAGLCYGSLASDTGGSIRWPCGATGLTGIKPTWGRVSRYGAFELAPSMDHVGPIGRCALDCAAILGVIAGPDCADPTSLPDPSPDLSNVAADPSGLRVGIDMRWLNEDVDPVVQGALADATATFRELGGQIVELEVPEMSRAVADWTDLCAVEAAVAHEDTFPARRDEYGPVLASVLERGPTLSALDQQKMLLRRMKLRGQLASLLETVDVLLAPVQPFAPLTLERLQTLGEQPELILDLQRFTAPFDLTGSPTITLPGGLTERGLPVGIQLIGSHLQEAKLCAAATAFQSITTWHRHHPPARDDQT